MCARLARTSRVASTSCATSSDWRGARPVVRCRLLRKQPSRLGRTRLLLISACTRHRHRRTYRQPRGLPETYLAQTRTWLFRLLETLLPGEIIPLLCF